jgi:methylmalonyl-CoA/ethylmalonyl-CoA epimerase
MMMWVKDVDAVQEAARLRGIEIAFEATSVTDLGIRAFFIRDNEGNLIEFIQDIKPVRGE